MYRIPPKKAHLTIIGILSSVFLQKVYRFEAMTLISGIHFFLFAGKYTALGALPIFAGKYTVLGALPIFRQYISSSIFKAVYSYIQIVADNYGVFCTYIF